MPGIEIETTGGVIVGGVRKSTKGEWHPVFQVHEPCFGTETGKHERCTVKSEHVGPPHSTIEQATDTLMATRERMGLDGWEGPSSKA